MLKKGLFLIICLVLFVSVNTYAIGNGLFIKEETIVNSQGETLIYYLGLREKNKLSNSLFIGIQGSQRDSNKRFDFWSNFAPDDADILLLEKYAFDNKELYNKTNCRQRRIQDIKFSVKYVIKNIYNGDLQSVILFGGSEGGMIIPVIANSLEKITHLVIMGAGGYSQAKAFEVLLEKGMHLGNIDNKKELFAKYNEIRKSPVENKFWLGNTYKRMSSYLDYYPEKYVRKLDIPVLYVIGKEDKSMPYESVKYLSDKLEGKNNFTFKILPGIDHRFTDKYGNSKLNYIIEKVIHPWYKSMGL